MLITCTAGAQLPVVSSGKIIRHEQFPSSYVTPRTIDVWLPSGYDGSKSFSVLYMHDGQMLFDSSITWNKQEWGVDETLGKLLQEGSAQNCIVVGIWNTPKRRTEYFPEKVFYNLPLPLRDSIQKDIGGKPQSNAYLSFITTELKPFIDSVYTTYRDRQHTFVAGSSMGGILSFYALCEYPGIFSGAACLSAHWPGSVYRNTKEVPEAFAHYAHQYLPDQPAKIYIDQGTEGLDAWYAYGNQLMKKEITKPGRKKLHSRTLTFSGSDHSERSWRERLATPLLYLLKP